MHKQIGVLGGNGTLGSRITKLLSDCHDIQIKVSTRTDNFAKLNHDHVKYEKLRLDHLEELKQFINGCYIIINCTGKFDKNIINCCLEYKVHYIDTSGMLNLSQSERQLNEVLKRNHLSLIQFVGVNPGLTEVLIAYSKELFTINKLELYFSGVGEISQSAILEMIETSEPPYSYSQRYIKEGELEKLDYMIKESNILVNRKHCYCVPIINHHFFNCVRKYKISAAYFFNVFNDKSIIYKMVEAKLHYQNNETENGITILMDAFKNESNDSNTYTLIKLIINENSGITIQSKLDWNALTAISVYYTVILMLKEQIKEYGIKNLYEAIDVKKLVDLFKVNTEITLKIIK